MATRFVFKIFGALGPAGSLVGIAEKICTAKYPRAYMFGDESEFKSKIDEDIKDERQRFIDKLFDEKQDFIKAKKELDNALQR